MRQILPSQEKRPVQTYFPQGRLGVDPLKAGKVTLNPVHIDQTVLISVGDVHLRRDAGAEAGYGDCVQDKGAVWKDFIVLIPGNLLEGMGPAKFQRVPGTYLPGEIDRSALRVLHSQPL